MEFVPRSEGSAVNDHTPIRLKIMGSCLPEIEAIKLYKSESGAIEINYDLE